MALHLMYQTSGFNELLGVIKATQWTANTKLNINTDWMECREDWEKNQT